MSENFKKLKTYSKTNKLVNYSTLFTDIADAPDNTRATSTRKKTKSSFPPPAKSHLLKNTQENKENNNKSSKKEKKTQQIHLFDESSSSSSSSNEDNEELEPKKRNPQPKPKRSKALTAACQKVVVQLQQQNIETSSINENNDENSSRRSASPSATAIIDFSSILSHQSQSKASSLSSKATPVAVAETKKISVPTAPVSVAAPVAGLGPRTRRQQQILTEINLKNDQLAGKVKPDNKAKHTASTSTPSGLRRRPLKCPQNVSVISTPGKAPPIMATKK